MAGFGMINMPACMTQSGRNGRLGVYPDERGNPYLQRFLSPDNFVQAPYNAQNFNRYSYVLNNPLMFTDPTGELWHLLFAAIFGGFVNWGMQGGEFTWEGLGHFAVGAVAGAVSAGIGTGLAASMSGSTFGAGFLGSQSAINAISTNFASSFWRGASIVGAAEFGGTFTKTFGNALLGGQNFGQAFSKGLKHGIIAGIHGALVGGIGGGIDAALDGRRFFSGATVEDVNRVLVDQNLPFVGQQGAYNCGPATGECASGGLFSQHELREFYGGCPHRDPVRDKYFWEMWGEKTGRRVKGVSGRKFNVNVSDLVSKMQSGNNIALSLPPELERVGHSVLANRIVKDKIITKLSGKQISKFRFYVMDPAGGQYIRILSSLTRRSNIFILFP